nr:KH domain-containing protein [Tanacetum cinerariifolium]
MAGRRNHDGKRSYPRSDHNANGRSKRRDKGDEKGRIFIGSDDTVYRYLCPGKKIGSIMGKGGDIVKQMRSESSAKINIGETVPGCDERVITIYSSGDETNDFGDNDRVCPAQDALFKVHDRVSDEMAADEMAVDENPEEASHVIVRLLVPTDQIGCVIGKGGNVVQTIRSDTGTQIRILKDKHMPTCALSSDELLQISGEASGVRRALFDIASRLHDFPSKTQQLLGNPSAASGVGTTGAPIMGLTPLVGPYGESGDWAHSLYPPPRHEAISKEFSLRLLCHTENIGGVIGKGGVFINQIRRESGAAITVGNATAEAEDCVISISAQEVFDDTFSPTIEAAIRLQPRCSERIERDSGPVTFTTRLLVPSSHIGCLIGKGGAKISEMRRITKANIRILTKEDVPKVAERDDEMVQITAEFDFAKDALVQVASRLRGDLFEREGALSTFVPVLPYLPMAPEVQNYERRESKGREHGHSYSGRDHGHSYSSREHGPSYANRHGSSDLPPYANRHGGSSDLPPNDGYGSYGNLQGRTSNDAYRAYSSYSSGRSGSSRDHSAARESRHNSASRRRDHRY